MWLLLAIACSPPGEEPVDSSSPADTDDTAVLPDATWGVGGGCDTPHTGGFNDFYEARRAVLVVGDDELSLAFADRIVGWYGDVFATFDVRTAAELTDADRERNLFVFGDVATNTLLSELNGSLPVWFADDRFYFGGYEWADPGNGIALIAPSPFAEGAWLTIYAGNTFEGAYSTFTIPTGGKDYAATRGRGVTMMEGGLCADTTPWTFDAGLGDDARLDWEAWKARLDETTTGDHVFRYLPDSDASADIATIGSARTGDLAALYAWIDTEPLDLPITTYLYPDNATKGEVTGNSGNAHANDLNLETHEVYSRSLDAATGHEDVHVVAWYRIGETEYALMGEGLAVGAGGEWWGASLDHWAETYEGSGEAPTLRALIDDFWGTDDGVSYPLAGHFVTFLMDGWGADVVKRIYVSDDIDAAFEDELGMTTDEVDAAWRATFPG